MDLTLGFILSPDHGNRPSSQNITYSQTDEKSPRGFVSLITHLCQKSFGLKLQLSFRPICNQYTVGFCITYNLMKCFCTGVTSHSTFIVNVMFELFILLVL